MNFGSSLTDPSPSTLTHVTDNALPIHFCVSLGRDNVSFNGNNYKLLIELKKNGSDSTTSSTATLFDRPRPFARACRNVCKWEAASLAPFAYANEQWPCNGNRVGRPIGVEIKVIATISTVGSVESKRQKKREQNRRCVTRWHHQIQKKGMSSKNRFDFIVFCFVLFFSKEKAPTAPGSASPDAGLLHRSSRRNHRKKNSVTIKKKTR